MEMALIILIWLVAPFAELGIIIVLAVINNNYRKKIRELTNRLQWRRPAQEKGMSGGDGELAGVQKVQDIQNSQSVDWIIPGGNVAENRTEMMSEGELERGLESAPEKELGREPEREPERALERELEKEQLPGVVSELPEVSAVSGMKEVTPARNLFFRPACKTRKSAHHSTKSEPGSFQGTAALIIGVVFVVLAGLIFATTAWHVLPSFCKVIMVLGFSALFFGASWMAGKVLKINRTSQAFYILGSVFLFLTVLAAGYFGLFGPEFILKGENRWRVLWAGSIVTEAALFAGLKKFNDRVYTQSCLWGLTVSMTFLMGAFGLGYSDGLNGMVYYSFLLVLWDYVRKNQIQKGREILMPGAFEREFQFFVMLHFWIFSALMAFQAAMGFLDVLTGNLLYPAFEITPWSTLALGLTAGGITLIALDKKNPVMNILHSISVALFLQYAGFCIHMDFTYQLLTGAVLTGAWFLAERKKDSPLCSPQGGCMFTVILAVDTAILVFIAFYCAVFSGHGIGEQAAASAACLMMAAVMAQWGNVYPVMRGMIPAVLFPLTMTAMTMLDRGAGMDVDYDIMVFAYLLAAAVWDVIRKDKFCVAVLAIGTLAQVMFWMFDPLPFFVLLAVYLLVRSFYMEGVRREWCVKGSCLYLLAGVYIMAGRVTENDVIRMMWVSGAFAAEYAAAFMRNRENVRQWFWDMAGLGVFLLTMAAFYMNPGLEVWNMVLCLISFAVFYVMLYSGGRIWPHLAAALAILPFPWIAVTQYGLSENRVYAYTAAFVLVSGFLFRRFKPVIEPAEFGENAHGTGKVDWFHILVVLDLFPMALAADREWGCAYILLTAMYVLQYTVLVQWRKGAVTLASALTALAFWIQPFIRWPELIYLEIQLIPAVLFIRMLSLVWKDRKGIHETQTVLYILCLAVMAVDAFRTGNVVDALILELVCLLVFLWAHVRKCSLWLRISGIIIITVALYMTKGFWLSLSWWVYLLAAGLGLIAFAAMNEMKKR